MKKLLIAIFIIMSLAFIVKCQRLFRPKFSKVKTSFVVEIREVSDTLTLNADVSDDTPV